MHSLREFETLQGSNRRAKARAKTNKPWRLRGVGLTEIVIGVALVSIFHVILMRIVVQQTRMNVVSEVVSGGRETALMLEHHLARDLAGLRVRSGEAPVRVDDEGHRLTFRARLSDDHEEEEIVYSLVSRDEETLIVERNGSQLVPAAFADLEFSLAREGRSAFLTVNVDVKGDDDRSSRSSILLHIPLPESFLDDTPAGDGELSEWTRVVEGRMEHVSRRYVFGWSWDPSHLMAARLQLVLDRGSAEERTISSYRLFERGDLEPVVTSSSTVGFVFELPEDEDPTQRESVELFARCQDDSSWTLLERQRMDDGYGDAWNPVGAAGIVDISPSELGDHFMVLALWVFDPSLPLGSDVRVGIELGSELAWVGVVENTLPAVGMSRKYVSVPMMDFDDAGSVRVSVLDSSGQHEKIIAAWPFG